MDDCLELTPHVSCGLDVFLHLLAILTHLGLLGEYSTHVEHAALD